MDPRSESLAGMVLNLEEYPADQSEEFLVAASTLGAKLKGLADAERLYRATTNYRDGEQS